MPALLPYRRLLLRFLDVRAGLFDASSDEFRLHFRFLSRQQRDFRLKGPVARQFNLDVVLSGADQ